MNVSTGMSNPPLPNTTGGFASAVFGQQPHEVDRVLSRLIQDNYDVAEARRGETSPEPDLPGTWTRDRKSTRLNSSHSCASRMPSSARKNKSQHRHNPQTP